MADAAAMLSESTSSAIGMRTHSGVAAKLFEALAKGGINIQMISTSEIKIAVIIDEAQIAEAAQLAHTAFALDAAQGELERRDLEL